MKRSIFIFVALLTLTISGAVAQETPVNDGVYYIYNQANGLFLSRGNDWGSHAVATPVGLPWKVSVAEGKYTLYMLDIAYGDKNPKGFDQYCYTDKTETVAFTPSGDAETGYSLMYDENYITCPTSIGLVNFTTTASKWQFLTPDQYDDKMDDLVTAQKKALIEQTLMDTTPGNFDKTLGKTGVTKNKTDFEIPTSGTWTTATVTNRSDDPKWYENCVEFRTGCSFSRTISGLTEGLYKVRVHAMKRIGEAAKCVDISKDYFLFLSDAYLLANGNAVQIQDWYSNYDGGGKPAEAKDVVDIWSKKETNYASEVYCYVGADGKLDLKVVAEAFGTDCWFVFGGVEYTRYSGYPQAVSEESANALLASVPTGKMNADVQTALNTAKNNLQSGRSPQNYLALQTAISNATASIEMYTQIAGVNAKAALLDASGQASYASTLAAYNAGTLTDVATAQAACITAILAQTTPGADMTAPLANPDFETGDLRGWTNNGFQFQDNHPYGDDGRFNRFAEKWVKGGSSLPDGAGISQSVTLPEGVYTLSADVIACQQSYTVDQTGVYLYIGEQKTLVSTPNDTPQRAEVKAHVKGAQTLGMKIENTNCNWAAIDNVKLTYDGPYVAVTSVTISGEAAVTVGNSITLTASVLPSDASFGTVTWSGDNDAVATIDATTGVVTALSVGTVHFTATAEGVASGAYTVTVTENPGGTCGTGVKWSYNPATTTLTISGSGAMEDYGPSNQPWANYKSSITRVVVGEGVTKVGKNAFLNCTKLTAVTLPESLESIGNYAFICTGLTSIVIPKGVTSIGSNPFNICQQLTSITVAEGNTAYTDGGGKALIETATNTLVTGFADTVIPDGVKIIGARAFRSISGLTTITLPASVTTIGTEAFASSGLTTIMLPAGVTTIGGSVFQSCANLTTVTLPASVTSIGSNVFADCYALTTVTCEATTPPTLGGYAFSGCGSITAVYVPEASLEAYKKAENWDYVQSKIQGFIGGSCGTGVSWRYDAATTTLTISGSGAMADYYDDVQPWSDYQTSITSVVIGEGVTKVGEMAFYDCSSLSLVTLPAGLTTIGESAFYNCRSLTAVTLPAGLTTIGGDAFANTGLMSVTLPAGLTTIGDRAFMGCSNMAYAILPEGLTTIGKNAFKDCSNMTSVTLPEGLTTIGYAAFSGCSSLTSVTLPESLTTIGGHAFESTELSSVTLPAGLTSLGEYAFSSCRNIATVTLSAGLTSMGAGAFQSCSVTSLTLPEGLKTIGEDAFEGNLQLTSVTLPESLISLGRNAFSSTGLTSIVIPKGVTSLGYNLTTGLGENPFTDCRSLTSITVAEGNTAYTDVGGKAVIETATGKLVTGLAGAEIPDDVKIIGVKAFHEMRNLTTVTLPMGLTTIEEFAFASSGLTSVRIPASVTTIGVMAFSDCPSLATVTCVGTTPPTAEMDLFGTHNVLTSIYVPNESLDKYKTASIWSQEASRMKGMECGTWGNNITWVYYPDITTLVIAGSGDMTDGQSGQSYPWASYNTAISSVVVEKGVTSIGKEAFLGNMALTSVTLPNGLTTIGDDAFSGVEITSVVIPASVTSIGRNPFMSCQQLTSITVAEGNTAYTDGGVNAIIEKATMKQITGVDVVPDGVVTIGSHAFFNMKGFTDITLPTSVTAIENGAFKCTGLTSVTIPANVTSMGVTAFNGCLDLTTVTCEGITPASGEQMFPFNITTIYVPGASVEAYKAADGWRFYQSMIVAMPQDQLTDYKSSQTAVADAMAQTGDSETCQNLIAKAKTDIGAVTYNPAKSVEENKAVVDAVITQLGTDLETQRKADFAAYKTTQKTAAEGLAQTGDSGDGTALITKVKDDLDALPYDAAKTPAENAAAVDAIITPLTAALEAQRKTDFAAYKTTQKTAAEGLAQTGEGVAFGNDACLNLIAQAKTDIEAINYDTAKTPAENAAVVDAIITQLGTDLVNQRKADFAAYQTVWKNAADGEAREGDSEACQNLIAQAKTDIDVLIYDNAKTPAENAALFDTIINSLTTALDGQRKADFAAYQTTQKDAVENMRQTGDSDDVDVLIAQAQNNIDVLSYQAANTPAQNAAAVDAIITQLGTDLETQRKADFADYKTAQKTAADGKAQTGDSNDVAALITKVKADLDALPYDIAKTPSENASAADALITQLGIDLENQRMADGADYKIVKKTTADNKAQTGDSEACQNLIAQAKAAIDALTYDSSKTPAENAAEADAIITQLGIDLENQRKSDFADYKSTQMTAADNAAQTGDSEACQNLIAQVKNSIDALIYDTARTPSENAAAVDDVITPLAAALETQRKADFADYKTAQMTAADNAAQTGDSEAVTALITQVKSDIDALTYITARTPSENAAAVDDVIAPLAAALEGQRKDDFAAYKTTQKTAADNAAQGGDSEAVTALITQVKDGIDALTYDTAKTPAENAAVVDAIITPLTAALEGQRKDDFAAYKTAQKTAADNAAQGGDSEAVTALITQVKSALDALTYDTAKTPSENAAVVDAIITPLTAALEGQRKDDFAAYKTAQKTAADNAAQGGDSEAVTALITQVKSALDALTYDTAKTPSENAAVVDAIITPLTAALETQRQSDFADYQTAQKTAADNEAQTGDSEAAQSIITQAKADIDALTYDTTKNPAENAALVDAVVEALKTSLANQREVDGFVAGYEALLGQYEEGSIEREMIQPALTAITQLAAKKSYTDEELATAGEVLTAYRNYMAQYDRAAALESSLLASVMAGQETTFKAGYLDAATITGLREVIEGYFTEGTLTIATETVHGTVTVANRVNAGDAVTFTLQPEEGYVLDSLVVYKTGDLATVVPGADNTFTMPAYDVTIDAWFHYPTTYTLRFFCDGEEVKEPVTLDTYADSVVCAAAEYLSIDVLDQEGTITGEYIYVEGNDDITAVKDAASNVIDLQYRYEEKFFSLILSGDFGRKCYGLGAANGIIYGTEAWVAYPEFLQSGDSLWYQPIGICNPDEFIYKETVMKDHSVILEYSRNYTTLDVTDDCIHDVVWFSEGEKVKGFTVSAESGQARGCSWGKSGFAAEDVILTTLEPGYYYITSRVWGGKDGFKGTIAVGEKVVEFDAVTGTQVITKIVRVTEETDVVALAGEESTMDGGYDWIFIRKAPTETMSIDMVIGETHYGTFVAPFDVTLPADVEAYMVTGIDENEDIVMESVGDVIPAGTPVVVYSETAVDETFTDEYVPGETTFSAGLLTGTIEVMKAPAGSYVLMVGANGDAVFGKVIKGDEPTMGIGRCWLETVLSSNELRLGGTTRIDALESDTDDDAYYDLSGRRVSEPIDGVYIHKGKKVLVK